MAPTDRIAITRGMKSMSNKAVLRKAHQILSQAANQPLNCVSDPSINLELCIYNIEVWRARQHEEHCTNAPLLKATAKHTF
jgi:hypothetical protein